MKVVAKLNQPDADMIAYLERTLEQARAGEVSGVLIVAQDRDGARYMTAGLKDRWAVLGFLTHAVHKLQED